MTNTNWLSAILACTLLLGVVGCGPKQPAAAPRTETKPSDGPLLAPPQQQTTPATP